MIRFPIIALVSCILSGLFSCSSYSRLYEKGNNKAIIRSLKNKALKGTLRNDELLVFEKALQTSLLDEINLLNSHLNSDRFEDWKEGFSYLDKLEKEQAKYFEYPQVNTDGMDFVDITYWDQAYSDKLYAYHTTNYNESYEKYLETKDKNYAIDAYYELEKVAYFERSSLNIDSLLQELTKLGRRTFEVKFYDEAFSAWELGQLKNNVFLTNSQWSDFGDASLYDYTVNITLNNLDKDSNNNQIQRQYTNDAITGYNAQTDPDGNIVQVPIIETYTATVSETGFTFIVNTAVEVEILFNETGKRVSYNSFSERFYDERREAYLIAGDLRAIPPEVNITNGSTITSTAQYDFSVLTEELMREVGRQVKYYIEGY